jgi:outer membrane protein assembly factor BamB
VFEAYTGLNDKDHDGKLAKDEVPDVEMKNRFAQIDADKDGSITRAEWERMSRIFDAAKNSVMCLRPGESGKPPAVAWRFERSIPYVPSPLFYKGRLYMVKDGGITTVLDAATGVLVKQARLPAGGSYYASPVAAGGLIYFASLSGDLSVVAPAESGYEVRASAALGETCAATPALSGGRLYVRTDRRLIAFARTPLTAGASGER